MWKGETSRATKYQDLLELQAIDAAWGAIDAVVACLLANHSQGLWRECVRRGDAVALDTSGTTVPTSVMWRISAHGDAIVTDAEQHLTGEQGMRLSIVFVKWSSLDCVCHHDRRWDSAAMDASVDWNQPLRIQSSWTGGAIVCDRRGHGVCRWCNRRVCRPHRVPNGSFQRDTSINTWWPALGSYSWTFDILVSTLSWAKAFPLIPTHLLAFDCDLWVRLSDSSASIIDLHLEALGDWFPAVFLVTLGGCHHLDSLEKLGGV
jgi:hypothetical protein